MCVFALFDCVCACVHVCVCVCPPGYVGRDCNGEFVCVCVCVCVHACTRAYSKNQTVVLANNLVTVVE